MVQVACSAPTRDEAFTCKPLMPFADAMKGLRRKGRCHENISWYHHNSKLRTKN
ncbi:MAG: hypothetical protein K2X48_00600 [Chitinophagaceae bacterium]|nr:hypothetical protein [Chitinophagaceae bacterium]